MKEVDVYSGWSSKELLEAFIKNNSKEVTDSKGQETVFEIIASGAIEAVKKRGEPSHVISMLTGFGGPQKATSEIEEIGVQFDDYPKPIGLLKYLISMVRGDDFIAMDFFSGSSTTAHAVMKLNSEDGGNRKFVMVQIPEPCNKNSIAFKSGFSTISEISKERIRRAGENILKGHTHSDWSKDIGFRVLKIDTSNMSDIYYSPDQISQGNLDLLVNNIKEDRTDEDLLFQVLLDWSVDLTLPIRKETICNKTVFFVDDNALVACFDSNITEELIKELAGLDPLRVVFRDDGFASDAVKINAEQIFKQLAPGTEVKSI